MTDARPPTCSRPSRPDTSCWPTVPLAATRFAPPSPSRGAWANIRDMPTRVKTFPFSAWVYRQRNAVERYFNKLKHFRAVATRYEQRDDNFLASVQLASIRIWLRSYESVT